MCVKVTSLNIHISGAVFILVKSASSLRENVCMCTRRAQVYLFLNATDKALPLIAAKMK